MERHEQSAASTGEAGVSERAQLARWAGVALAVTLASIVIQHGGPGTIGGQRVSGTSDVGAIAAFYSHPEMVAYWWQGGVSFLGLVAFAVAFRAYVRTFGVSAGTALVLDVATAIALLEAPVIAVELGLQAALVQVVGARTTGATGVLPLFAAWDWIYNGMVYWFEAAWMAGLAVAAWRARALPRWVTAVGGLAAAGLFFNNLALVVGIPDAATLVPTAVFVVWFLVASITLLRGGVGARPTAQARAALAVAS